MTTGKTNDKINVTITRIPHQQPASKAAAGITGMHVAQAKMLNQQCRGAA